MRNASHNFSFFNWCLCRYGIHFLLMDVTTEDPWRYYTALLTYVEICIKKVLL